MNEMKPYDAIKNDIVERLRVMGKYVQNSGKSVTSIRTYTEKRPQYPYSFLTQIIIYIVIYMCAQLLNHIHLFVASCTVAQQAPLPIEFFRQEYWSRVPFPTPEDLSIYILLYIQMYVSYITHKYKYNSFISSVSHV